MVTGAVVVAVARRPGLWLTAARQAARLAPRGWWHRSPFLPLPDDRYLAFRAVTQYGDASRQPDTADVVQFLEWCRHLRSAA
jgi:hypothetical protein